MQPRGRAVVLLTSLLLVALLLFARPAQADPHAVFYTAVGQQQLFFNILAALNQAEYVEPALQSVGLLAGNSREEILRQREQAGFDPESNVLVNSTQTDLASVLTRNITLEGNDLWTAYLAHQFALEAARRENTDEVLRIYCERGLGRKGCQDAEQEDQKQKESDRQKAFVVDPVGYAKDAILGGAASVLSSSFDPGSADQAARRDALKNDSISKNPRPFDSSLAQLRESTKDNPETRQVADRLVSMARTAFLPDRVDPNLFTDIKIENGKFALAIDPPSNRSVGIAQAQTGQDFINTYTAKLVAVLGAPGDMLATAARGAHEVATFAEVKEDRGAVGDSDLYPKVEEKEEGGSAGNQAVVTTVEGRLTVPAHAKTAATETALNILGTTEQNLQHAPPDAEFLSGRQELVERGQAGGAQSVLGTTTTSDASSTVDPSTGRVLHAVSNDPEAGDHQPQTVHLPPDTIAAGFHHEHGAGLLLEAIGYKSGRGGLAPCAECAGNDYGLVILRKINEKRL